MRNYQQYLKTIAALLIGCTLLFSPSSISFAEPTSNGLGESARPLSPADADRIATVVDQVRRYYVEPIDEKKLVDYAISGMISNLDPHSDYLDETALKDLQTITSGKFGGIGVEIVPSDGVIKVVAPLDDTPAYKAGIKAGDLILRIDDKLVRNMLLRDVVGMIQGKIGTKVHLTVFRKGAKKLMEFYIVRDTIQYKSVKTEVYPGNYAYIRIAVFQETTAGDLEKQIKQLQDKAKAPLKGAILDLRSNPGGLLDSAVDVTQSFLDTNKLKYKGLIVYTKGRMPSSDIKAVAAGKDLLKGIPIVVLIDEGSASAAEIVAGALQDQKRAILVGQRSFGKGSVQTVLGIDETSAIKLTTALYYTPSGRSIQAKGIDPDIVVPQMTIPHDKSSEDEDLISVTEADLEKHLDNADSKESASDPKSSDDAVVDKKDKDKKMQDILYSDFQLYEALNILKGLGVGKAS